MVDKRSWVGAGARRRLVVWGLVLAGWAYACGGDVGTIEAGEQGRVAGQIRWPLVVTQVEPVAGKGADPLRAERTFRAPAVGRSRLVLVGVDGSVRRLAASFESARDAEVSFDGKRILFAGRRKAGDRWAIYEMGVDGSGIRQVTHFAGDCRSPRYLSTLYTIVSSKPWYQVLFVGSPASGGGSELYSCKLDGSELARLTYTLSRVMDPLLMRDGRVVFGAWQATGSGRGRVGLLGINLDGTDYATFAGEQGRRVRQMPCVTTRGLVVFVEGEGVARDGSGMLSCVGVRRPLHSYRRITGPEDGLFRSPSPLPDGTILVSRRSGVAGGTHGVYRFDPATKKVDRLFDDPRYDEIEAKVVGPRPEPDGRSSVVRGEDPHGEFYCLDVYTSDVKLARGTVKRVRLVEGRAAGPGDPRRTGPGDPGETGGRPAGLPRVEERILGEAAVERDGSFSVKVPANTPVRIELLDEDGLSIRSCRWIWARNREPRGCVGCHEDGELTPENWFVDAMKEPPVLLEPPPEKHGAGEGAEWKAARGGTK